MKTIFFFSLMVSTVWAGPFLVSDPAPLAVGGQFEIKEGTATILTAATQPDGSIKADLAAVTAGKHDYQIRYAITDPLWGTAYSAYVPLSFSRPSLAAPSVTGAKLVP